MQGLLLFGTADAIQILKKWRGVANEGEKAVIAVRTGSPMSACEWQHEDDDETYRSEEKRTEMQENFKARLRELDTHGQREPGAGFTQPSVCLFSRGGKESGLKGTQVLASLTARVNSRNLEFIRLFPKIKLVK